MRSGVRSSCRVLSAVSRPNADGYAAPGAWWGRAHERPLLRAGWAIRDRRALGEWGASGDLGLAAASSIVLAAGPFLATDCVTRASSRRQGSRSSWDPAGSSGRLWAWPRRPPKASGFHGLVGFDFDGNGTVDFQTFVVGPDDELPELAQFNGPSCHGITNVTDYFAECV